MGWSDTKTSPLYERGCKYCSLCPMFNSYATRETKSRRYTQEMTLYFVEIKNYKGRKGEIKTHKSKIEKFSESKRNEHSQKNLQLTTA